VITYRIRHDFDSIPELRHEFDLATTPVTGLQYSFSSSLTAMTDLSLFAEYNKLAQDLIEAATKDQLAECAQLMALNLAHYKGMYGEIPLEETLATLAAGTPNDEQATMLTDGMGIFVGLLGSVCSGLDEAKH
jgi:hypothetical protein